MSANEHLCEDCSAVSKSHRLTLKISKATGPGSRGGKVLGMTRSGKPIYQHGGGTQNYHAIDHTDAAESHGAHGMLARVKGDVGGMNHHRAMAKEHLDAAAGPKPSASARPIHQRIKDHFTNMSGMGGAAMAHAKSMTGDDMNSIQILKSYLAKSKVRSGNVDADTVDEVDGDLTGASAMGKEENAPGGWDDQPAADKKVKKKFTGHEQSDSKNAGRSVEAQTGVGDINVKQDRLNNAGPFDCEGGEPGNISEASPTKTVDGSVYRSMRDDEDEKLVKGVKRGEGSKGGHIIGHTKSGKPVYAGKDSPSYGAMFSKQDHKDAQKLHEKAAEKGKDNGADLNHEEVAQNHEAGADARYGNDAGHIAVQRDSGRVVHGDGSGTANYDAGDHISAAVAHKAAAAHATDHGDSDRAKLHQKLSTKHRKLANAEMTADNRKAGGKGGGNHAEAWEHYTNNTSVMHNGPSKQATTYKKSDDERDLSKAEGSRGGKVIGHTKAGHAVYAGHQAGHSKYKGFTRQDHKDAAKLHEGHAKKTGNDWHESMAEEHHEIAGRTNMKTGANTGKSLDAPDFYKGGNGKLYQRQVHDFGVVQHTAGGMDQYCAELAKGGSFWANGSHWHNTSDPGVAQMVMCKSCDHAHSVMYTACPECQASGDFSKSMAQPSLHFAAPVRPIEPESDIVRFD